MSASFPRRSAAVAALAVAASSGIALVAASPAAAADSRVHTSLSIRVEKPGVNPGGGDWISGQLQSRHVSLWDRRVALQDKPAGTTSWVFDKANRTRKDGKVGFQVEPTVNTRYRLVFAGNEKMKPSASGVVLVHAWVKATSLVETLGSNVLQPGGSTTVNGALSASGTPIADGTVLLQSRTNAQKNFHRAGSGATGDDGSISFPVTPAVNTHYRLVFRKTATNGYAQSATGTVHIQRPSALTITGRANKANQEVISGVLHDGNLKITGNQIELQSAPAGTTTFTTIAHQRTNRHGAVTFKVASPSASTSYQLVWTGGPNFAACQSQVITVTVSSAV
jgi:hypothetical protein